MNERVKANLRLGAMLALLLGLILTAPRVAISQAENVITTLKQLSRTRPNIVHYREIGRSSNHRPIAAIKISDNANLEEDEPAFLFVGIIHGAEPLGLKITLKLIQEFIDSYGKNHDITDWVNAYEIWFVPVLNVWGYERRARKNANGVDLNRNFDFRWERCIATNQDCANPASPFYRGPAPFSEPETRAIRDLVLEQRPLFGITFHAGNPSPSGEVMRPWATNEIPPPPDNIKLLEVAQNFAMWVRQSREGGGFCRSDSPIFDVSVCAPPVMRMLGAYGQSSNWVYAAAGTFDYIIEIAPKPFNDRFLYTPDPTDDNPLILLAALEHIRNYSDAIRGWLRWFLLGKQNNHFVFRGPGLTGKITDAATNQPLAATIEIEGFNGPYTQPRTSDPLTGRFWRLLPAGSYTVTITKSGYRPWAGSIEVRNGALAPLNVTLVPER